MLDRTAESFPMVLYRRFNDGETIQQLAATFGIPEERVAQRVRAAALSAERLKTQEGLLELRARLAEH
jgi:hypothetical protein